MKKTEFFAYRIFSFLLGFSLLGFVLFAPGCEREELSVTPYPEVEPRNADTVFVAGADFPTYEETSLTWSVKKHGESRWRILYKMQGNSMMGAIECARVVIE